MGEYQIQCTACGRLYTDTGSNECPDRHAALQRTVYSAQRLQCADLPGMMRFFDWLPIHHKPTVTAGPVTYRSAALARELGLSNLYITFNGFWPEKGAATKTCSFKELEAAAYMNVIDRESAYEQLKKKAETAAVVKIPDVPVKKPQKTAASGAGDVIGSAAKSAAHAIGSQLGREIMRGVLGSLTGTRKK